MSWDIRGAKRPQRLSLRRLIAAALAAALAATVWAAPPARERGAAPPPTASGLIVQLRDAPEHAAFVNERAQRLAAGSQDTPSPLAAHEHARWQRTLQAAPEMRIARRDAVGASAQRLAFERPLTLEQAQALADKLAARPEVAWAAPAVRERRLQAATNPPNDLYFAGFDGQWWLQPVQGSDGLPLARRLRGVAGFQTAWIQQTAGSASTSAAVAVLDSGITDHPELAGRTLPGYDLVSDSVYANDGDGRDGDPHDPGDWVNASDRSSDPARFGSCIDEPSSWHGTAIAGMLAAITNNGAGMAAMNWRTPVLPVRVAGKCGAEAGDIIDGMRWAAGLPVCRRSDANGVCLEMARANANPVRVINISFGGTGACDGATAPYQSTIDELRNRGVVIVAAAGNEWTTPTRPAKCPGVVGVVALNRDGFKSNYSNFGPELTASGIATVGGDDDDPTALWSALADSGVLSLGNDGDTVPLANGHSYYTYFGTSFSAPVVAGAISLMLSVNPNLTYAQIVQGLKASARPHVTSTLPGVNACSASNPGRCLCTTATCGAGILDVVRALQYAAGQMPSAIGAEVINPSDLRASAALGPDRPPNSSGGGGTGGGSSGGGAMSAAWLAALAFAALALARRRPR